MPMEVALEPTRAVSQFVANLAYEDLPVSVVTMTKELLIDWLGSAVAGKGNRAVAAFEAFADAMGPAEGASQILVSRRRTSPYFAALVNGASSHVVEQDDVHNGSVFHPAAVVFPAVLAMAEAEGISGRKVIEAVVCGYEVGIRLGEALGRTHYEVFHTTGTAGTVAAAAAVAKLIGLEEEGIMDAIGTAGTQAAGLWEFLKDAADSKQVHTAKAAADGLLSGVLARSGVTGAKRIVEGRAGMANAMSQDADPERLTDHLGTRWAILEMSLKWHASCRHTHPAADALAQVVLREGLRPQDIATITAEVHQGAINVLGPVVNPKTVHQAKFSMPRVLGLIAVHGRADLAAFDEHALGDPDVVAFEERVRMVLDPEVDGAYPKKWIGKVVVETVDGRRLTGRVNDPKGDPENPLTRGEINAKALRLAAYKSAASEQEMQVAIARIDNLEQENSIRPLL